LRSSILDSKRAFVKLWHKLLEKKGSCALVCVEIGEKNKSVHLHILYWGYYVPQKKLSDEWKRLTGGKWYADIRLVKGRGGIREVTKYISKGVSVEGEYIDDLYEIEKALKGLRRVMTYGIFYNRKIQKTILICPVCGGKVWKYEKRYDSEYEKKTIRDIIYRFNLFVRASPFYSKRVGSVGVFVK